MKKLVLLSLVLSIGLLGFSQERTQIKKSIQNISKTMVYVNPTDEVVDVTHAPNPFVSNYKDLVGEDVIGTTYYDLQSNTMVSNRIHVYSDGTIGAVWTRGIDTPPGFDDRGTGYNFYDGSAWGPSPTARIEDERVGWPSYAPLGENGEIVVAHLASGLKISTREQKGTGEWTYQTLDGPAPADLTWPRMITAGENNNTVHLLANSYVAYGGQETALLYYRSLDSGANWDIEAQVIEGLGPDYYGRVGADDYVWAEPNGGAIAFLISSKWYNDMLMMKSTDNGDSWEKTIIWEHPYPFYDWDVTVTDTFCCVDNSASITLDSEGIAHVTFGISRVNHPETGNTYSLYFLTDGIGYWNETMETFSNNLNALNPWGHEDSELVDDYSLIGWTQDVNGNGEIDYFTTNYDFFQTYRTPGVSTMPTIAVDDYGRVIIAYSSTTETYDNTVCNYKHVWLRTRALDETWGDFEDLNVDINHIFDECIYPVIGQNINGSAYILYQADYEPGLALDDAHGYDENRMIVANYDLNVGIEENEFNAASVSQNFPNPFTNTSIVSVNLTKAADLSLEVFNLTGQKVYEVSNGHSNAGTHNLVINAENLSSGIYFYTVNAGNNAITKKMIIY
ncbi:MAG: T9SS type A sorting domain-containing protein [Bacteroidales bacterium]|nr:T9SS type A sorting domain-containing protein [Bacteroidales bacterium]